METRLGGAGGEKLDDGLFSTNKRSRDKIDWASWVIILNLVVEL